MPVPINAVQLFSMRLWPVSRSSPRGRFLTTHDAGQISPSTRFTVLQQAKTGKSRPAAREPLECVALARPGEGAEDGSQKASQGFGWEMLVWSPSNRLFTMHMNESASAHPRANEKPFLLRSSLKKEGL
jgi:hypothetical protein